MSTKRIIVETLLKTPEPAAPSPTLPVQEIPTHDIDLAKLLSNTTFILQREIQHLHKESVGGKLSSASARDLVSYVKLLAELEENEGKLLEEMTTEQLEAILKTRSAAGSSTDK